jgi:hypothetical protein
MKIFQLLLFSFLLSYRIGTSIAQNQQCRDGMTAIATDANLNELDDANACAEKFLNSDGTNFDCSVDGSSNAQAYTEACEAAGGKHYVTDLRMECTYSSDALSGVSDDISLTWSIQNGNICLAGACTQSDIEAIYSTSIDEVSSTGNCELTIGDTNDGIFSRGFCHIFVRACSHSWHVGCNFELVDVRSKISPGLP